MKTALKVLESTWIYFLVSFYDPTNSHTYFGQKIFTIRWIATVVLLGGFDFTSAFKNNDEFQFHEKLLDKFISSNHHKSVSICLQNKISTETAETKQSGIGELIISYWLIRERRTTDRILIGGLKLEREIWSWWSFYLNSAGRTTTKKCLVSNRLCSLRQRLDS